MEKGPDFVIENYGSIVLLRAYSAEAELALRDITGETQSWQWQETALAIEPRYVNPIVDQLMADGWLVGGG